MPETEERPSHGQPTFFVTGSRFYGAYDASSRVEALGA